jgi:prepilin-type N-terminal cleavage/methylation domain-containing protein
MLARIRNAHEEREGGFTLIELLVVMIIIGILAAIAIPVFLNQRKKANDTAGKADVSTLGKEIATYYVDNTAAPAVTGPAGGRYTVAGADAGKVSNNIALNSFNATSAQAWCVDVAVTGGMQSNFKYSANSGMGTGACVAGTDY